MSVTDDDIINDGLIKIAVTNIFYLVWKSERRNFFCLATSLQIFQTAPVPALSLWSCIPQKTKMKMHNSCLSLSSNFLNNTIFLFISRNNMRFEKMVEIIQPHVGVAEQALSASTKPRGSRWHPLCRAGGGAGRAQPAEKPVGLRSMQSA